MKYFCGTRFFEENLGIDPFSIYAPRETSWVKSAKTLKFEGKAQSGPVYYGVVNLKLKSVEHI